MVAKLEAQLELQSAGIGSCVALIEEWLTMYGGAMAAKIYSP